MIRIENGKRRERKSSKEEEKKNRERTKKRKRDGQATAGVVLGHQRTALLYVIHEAGLDVGHICIGIVSADANYDGVEATQVTGGNVVFVQFRYLETNVGQRFGDGISGTGEIADVFAGDFQIQLGHWCAGVEVDQLHGNVVVVNLHQLTAVAIFHTV